MSRGSTLPPIGSSIAASINRSIASLVGATETFLDISTAIVSTKISEKGVRGVRADAARNMRKAARGVEIGVGGTGEGRGWNTGRGGYD